MTKTQSELSFIKLIGQQKEREKDQSRRKSF